MQINWLYLNLNQFKRAIKSEVITTSYEVIEKPIFAFDCVYNRESTENKAVYFSSADDLVEKLNDSSIDLASNASAMSEIADRRYRWETIARQYESLY